MLTTGPKSKFFFEYLSLSTKRQGIICDKKKNMFICKKKKKFMKSQGFE